MDQNQLGRIYCRFDDLVALAQRRWGDAALQAASISRGFADRRELSRLAVAQFVGIRQPSINSLANNTTTRYDFGTLGRLCGFFGCTVGHLLVYVPVDAVLPHLTDPAILQWDAPPVPEVIHQTCIKSKLPDILNIWNTRAQIATATGLNWNVLHTQAQDDVRRIDQRTLVGICSALPAEIDDLFVVQPCSVAAQPL